MVRQTLKVLEHSPKDFSRVSDHFVTLDIKVLMHSEIFIETSINIYTAKKLLFSLKI